MDLTINFVWIGANPLKWLECFMIYSWKRLGCTVNIFTHFPNSSKVRNKQHDHQSLGGLPTGLVNVFDLKTVIEAAGTEGGTMPKTRQVLRAWFPIQMPAWNMGGQLFTFNMADLCKSYLAATRVGIVMDLKIGPSPHIKEFYETGVFSKSFIGCKRVGTVENQLMGSMSSDDTKRAKYGAGFDFALFDAKRCRPEDMTTEPHNPNKPWYPQATAAHNRAMGAGKPFLPQGLAGDWVDIGKQAKPFTALGLGQCLFTGIAGEAEAGAVRIFKKESDQTNKSGNVPTTDGERLDAQRLALEELGRLSPDADGDDMKALRVLSTKT